MVAPRVSFIGAGTAAAQPAGGLPGGYYVMAGTATNTYSLLQLDDITAVLDTATADNFRPFNAQTADGRLFVISGPFGGTAVELYEFSQSAGALTVGTVGAVALDPVSTASLSVAPDGDEVAIPWSSGGSYGVKIVSTTDASTVSDISSSGDMLYSAAAGAAQIIKWDFSGQQWRLMDSGGTVSSLAFPGDLTNAYPPMTRPVSTSTFLAVSGIDDFPEPASFRINISLLSTTGSTLSSAWSTDLTTTWPFDDASDWSVVTSTFGNWGLIVPRAPFGMSESTAEFYLVDLLTGRAYGTGKTSDFGTAFDAGAWDRTAFFAGADYVYWWNDDTQLVRAWSVTYATTPPTLRQRQSPRRSPSRVGYPALRQRQSPFIR